ncbi:hypothetical protein FNF28_07761 [Cafeteria roenbergensis]|uniref:Fibronectin type III-like domain-containing protein n=1 Tax=Cafeteria roenbergensis TaxID=33653 RepID=A0A5A8BZ79_CAFRO|nr:hypothetical protein FNF28_07761 [Cafeteria roenbergensis]
MPTTGDSSPTAVARPCTGKYSLLPFCNTSLPVVERVDDLVARINVSDFPGLFVNGQAAIPYLGIPSYQVWSEATHGVGFSPGVSFEPPTPNATSFPEPILTAASFNTSLFVAVGAAVSDEARAMNNVGTAGETFWAPNINLARDPRWGRIQETPGEDPFLSGQWAIHYVRGLQEGEDPRYLKVSADCKHFAAYDMENSDGYTRHNFSANVTAQDLHDSYLPHFQDCVMSGRVSSVMGSYNAVRVIGRDEVAIPSNANPFLLRTILREAWGLDAFGYVTSDCGAVFDIQYNHKFTQTTDETNKVVLEAGMSTNCGEFMLLTLAGALDDGSVSVELAQDALKAVFSTRMRLGQFDPYEDQPYRQIGLGVIHSDAHQALALDAARQGIVLLKNQGSTLPLKASSVATLGVVGPNANATTQMLGNYAGAPFRVVSPSQGLASYATSLNQAAGCDTTLCESDSGFASAELVAAASDALVVVVGDDDKICGEANDRLTISLPGMQAALVAKVAAAAKLAGPSRPVVVVVMSGEPVDLSLARDDPNVDAIVWMGYPGMMGGQAMADVLFGAAVPAGRLPVTFYEADFVNQVRMINMNFRPGLCDGEGGSCTNPGHTHRFYTGAPVFAFGHGLSYTTFQYNWSQSPLRSKAVTTLRTLAQGRPSMAHVPPADTAGVFVSFQVNVTNTGSVAADDVILCFLEPPGAGTAGTPRQLLAGFQRVHLAPGQMTELTFGPSARHFLLAGQAGEPTVRTGPWIIRIGVKDEQFIRLGGAAPILHELLLTE